MNRDDNFPQVTTILTTFRRPKLLRRAIASVLNQTYPAIKVLVLDDASGDETEEIVTAMAKRDSRITYIRHETNIGMTPNWQFGLEHVETPYFSFLSDDDIHLPGFYTAAVESLESRQDIDFFCGSTIKFDELGGIRKVSTATWAEGLYRPYQGMLKMMQQAISWDGIVFRHRLIERIGTLRNIYSTDYDFLVRAARFAAFVVSHQPCAMFMEHRGRGFGHLDFLKIFHEFFPMALGILGGEDLPPDIRAEAWAIMNQYGLVTGKYLFLKNIVEGHPQKALEVANYLRRFTVNSPEALKFAAIARLAITFPFVGKYIARRIDRRNFSSVSHQKGYLKQYGQWIRYANSLTHDG